MAEEKESPEKTTACNGNGAVEEESKSKVPQLTDSQVTDSKETPSVDHEVKAAQDRYLRLAAEFENYKKRTQRDQEEFGKYANERLLKELLPVLDNLQRALQHANQSGGINGLVQGVELTCKQYLEVLSRFGVRPILSVGLPFDPAVHQAVATVEPKGHAPHTIVEEHEKGYYLHDRVLRPASVTVAADGPDAGSETQVASQGSDEC